MSARKGPQARLGWSGMTHRGKVRRNNEDAFLALVFDGSQAHYLGKTGEAPIDGGDFVFAVSDGMGGANAGEFASRVAVEKITRLMNRGFRPAEETPVFKFEGRLLELFNAIHRDLTVIGGSYEECKGMGATLSLCWFTPQWLHIAHVGDSRIYRMPAGGKLCQLSHDHSHVGWLRRSGRISELEARVHPRRNALEQALGAGHQFLEPQISTLEWNCGDRFLLCSDGIVEGLWDRRIGEILGADAPLGGLAPTLVTEAVAISGRDNATAVVIGALKNPESKGKSVKGTVSK